VSLKKRKKKTPLPLVDASAGAALHTHTYILSRPVINPPKFPVIIYFVSPKRKREKKRERKGKKLNPAMRWRARFLNRK
jgi:hypothetical protein